MGDTAKPDRFTLSRWSRRKLASAREKADAAEAVPVAAPVPGASAQVVATEVAPPPGMDAAAAPELPPVESLTIDSDFAAFLKPDVDDSLRRKALRKLFSDPQFNVMDGLDVYIDDYSKTTPIPDDLVGKLVHARFLLDPPKTRVNAQGFVEDVPDQESPPPVEPKGDEAGHDDTERAGQAEASAPSSAAPEPVAAPRNVVSEPTEQAPAHQPMAALQPRRGTPAEPAR
jgi:hypothetical protein